MATSTSDEDSLEYVEEVVYEEVTDEEEDGDGQEIERLLREVSAPAATDKSQIQPTPAAAADDEHDHHTFHDVHLSEGGTENRTSTEAAAAVSGTDSAHGSTSSSQSAAAAGDNATDKQQAGSDQPGSKVAAEVAKAASQAAHKLQGGFLQAFSSATVLGGGSSKPSTPTAAQQQQQHISDTATAAAAAAAAAAAGLSSKLSGGLSGLSSWWSTLDQSLAANNAPLTVGNAPADKLRSASSPESQLSATFGLAADENLVESYSCALLQTYSCAHNSLTPPMQVSIEGKMYITDKHTCFQALDKDTAPSSSSDGSRNSSSGRPTVTTRSRSRPPLIFKISHADVASATREPNPIKTLAASDLLQIVIRSNSGQTSGAISKGVMTVGKGGGGPKGGVDGGWRVLFHGFEPISGLDGALALIEHLKDS